MKRVSVLVGAMALVLLTAPAWAAGTPPGGAQPPGNNPLNGVPATLKAKIAADEKTVRADKQALDDAEDAAGLPLTFPPPNPGPKPGTKPPPPPPSVTPPPPETPAQRLGDMIQHVEKEIERVEKLLARPNLPATVTSAAQTLDTDLNTLKTDLTTAEAAVGGQK